MNKNKRIKTQRSKNKLSEKIKISKKDMNNILVPNNRTILVYESLGIFCFKLISFYSTFAL